MAMKPLVYRVGHANPKSGDTRIAAHMNCANCGRHEFVTLGAVHANSPEHVAKRFVEHGWEFNIHNASQCVCPVCIAERKTAPVKQALGLNPAGTVELNKRTATLLFDRAFKNALTSDGDDTMNMKKTTEAASQENADPSVVVKSLTPEQRTRIRTALDSHFDDSKGCYLDGKSDQRIGDELGIPWAAVSAVRELAYGPILTDPTLDEVEQALAKAVGVATDLERRLVSLTRELDTLHKTKVEMDGKLRAVQSEIATATTKLSEARRRLGLK